MQSFNILSFILGFILISCILSQTINIEVSTELEELDFTNETSSSKTFKVSISPNCTVNYKFIRIIATPLHNNSRLYLSTTDSYPRPKKFDISAIEEGVNQIYVPRTYFENTSNKYFYMNSNCGTRGEICNFTISFQLVEMIHAEKSVRYDFLTFDYEEYLIYFNKISENEEENQIMVTASGGAKGHHGSRNNVKLTLSYVYNEGNNSIPIEVNPDTMFNGAGTTFFENDYSKLGEGYFLARVRGPTNTYINFMVRPVNIECDLPVDGKAIYGFLQGDNVDLFKLTGYNNSDLIDVINDDTIIQVSIVVKGDLEISKSIDSFCDRENPDTTTVNIKDELQAILTFTSEEIENGITYICIQGHNIRAKANAFIMEVHDVTDQKISYIVTEPLVNGYLYIDYLKFNEVRTYRHSKYLETGLTKYNCKLLEGKIEVAVVTCDGFPECRFNKDTVEKRTRVDSKLLTPIDNYYTTTVNKDLETNAYGPIQYLLTVLCLIEKCKFEVSFSDEEDSLLLREDSRIAHYISPTSTNYYHFKITDFDKVSKVFVYLRTISGDSNIEVLDDVTERKKYYLENTKILEFYEHEYTGLYTLNVTGSVGSFYLLSYSVLLENQTEEDKVFDIGLGISFIEGIKKGNKIRKFKMFHDKTRGNNTHYLSAFYPINCNIGVKFFEKEIIPINGIYQHEIIANDSHYKEDYFQYQVEVKSFNDNSSYDNNFCLFYITAQEISSDSNSIISEGASINFALTPNIKEINFVYPHSAGISDILIKYNLENTYLVGMKPIIEGHQQTELTFSRSSSLVIKSSDIRMYCPNEDQVCSINIQFYAHEESAKSTIPINFIIKSKDNTPATLIKNKIQVDLVAENNIQYYLVDISPEDKGEVVINFKKGSGRMFAKMVGKDADPDENPDWKFRVRLPRPDEKEESVGEFDPFKNNIKYDATKLYKYGIPVCKNGCELYIGVISTDTTKPYQDQNDYLEYSIYIRPELNTSSSDSEKHQELINRVMIDLLPNEYVTGYIESSSDVHYYFFDVQDDCDFIEVEFQSESCTLYINNGTNYPDPGNSKWEVNSKISSSILAITKNDLGLENLKGVEFRMAVNSKKYDELMSMAYIFRIRMIKRSSKSIIEINGNVATVCEIKKENDFCDLLYPLSDYEFNIKNSLFIYAEPEIITDIEMYFNPIITYEFDRMTAEQIEEILPRPSKAKKSTENEAIKNYLELTKDDLIDAGNKPYALISIKSSKPSIINIYTTMREQVSITSLNPYSKLLFQRNQNDIISFNTKGDQDYIFYITCINGEGKAYFESEKEQEDKYKTISGSGTQFSLALPQRKEDKLIIEPTGESGIIFYINENIHPEVREMELIKFGFSGRIVYDEANLINFPLTYYMKIQDEEESINFNLHINNLVTNFNPIDGGNYTDVLDIYGWVVDENMITSMMRSKRKNPPNSEAVRGRYDKSLTTAKLYFTSDQIKDKGKDMIKYLVFNLNKNERMNTNIQSMTLHISAMPFSNKLYNSPYNLYISGNILKSNKAPLCNYHRLRVGNQGDKYMQIELGILSSNVNYNIKDINNRTIVYANEMAFSDGKYKGVVSLEDNNNDLYLELCRKNITIAHEASLNYIFKVKSSVSNSFTNFKVDTAGLQFQFNNNERQSSLKLTIPKVFKDGKGAPAVYYIRLYPKEAFDSNDNPNTITFISYYAYATYIYKIFGTSEEPEIITTTIENFPEDKPYIVTIVAVTTEEEKEEIFAYPPIIDPYKKEGQNKTEDDDKTYIIILIVSISLVVIILGIIAYFIMRMMKQKKSLEEEISKANRLVSSFSVGPNQEPSIE